MTRALVLRAPGTNCDMEMLRAFELAGARASLVHLDVLAGEPQRLEDADLVGFPGGFSFGDDIASGRIFAMKLRERLYPALRAVIERGCPIIGACNGFQVLVQVGLLPGPGAGAGWPQTPPNQTVALTDNQDARFHDRWVQLAPEASSRCVWTRDLASTYPESLRDDVLRFPVAHGEGRLVTADADVLSSLEQGGQVPLRYRDNFNGSQSAIAGLCDASGLVFGLMPHPERYLEWTRHPYFTRLPREVRRLPTPGLLMFQHAVHAARRGRPLVAR